MILELKRQGLGVSAIARQTGLDRKTVRKYLAQGRPQPARHHHHLLETKHLAQAVASRRRAGLICGPDLLLAHISALGWAHIRLTSQYWGAASRGKL